MRPKSFSYRRVAMLAACVLALLPMAAAAYDWPQFNGNEQHYGNNTAETAINASNVSTLKQLFQVTFAGENDGIPVYQGGVTTPKGVKDMLYLTMRDGGIMALDAHDGSTVWSHATRTTSCISTDGSKPCYTTSSPVIDPNNKYVYSYDHDGYVHKYQVGDGTEVTSGGWPEMVSAKPDQEKQSSALAYAIAADNTPYLYAATAGYNGDGGDYQGHVTTINLNTGSQHVFNAVCSNKIDVHFIKNGNTSNDCPQVQTAIWGRPGVVYDPDTNKIYMATGNGTFNPSSFDWGDTVFALNPDGTGAGNGNPVDSYTPTNYQQLQNNDTDIGSTSPAILPTSGYPNIKYKHLAVQGGKDSNLRLLNLDNLSGQGATGKTGGELQIVALPGGSVINFMPAVWVNPADNSTWLYANNYNNMNAYKLTVDGSGNPSLVSAWASPVNLGGSSPLVANNVLYYASASTVSAYDPTTGNKLWTGNLPGGIHWQSPVVANGVLYMTDGAKYQTTGGHIAAFSLNGATPTTPTTAPTNTATTTAPTGTTTAPTSTTGTPTATTPTTPTPTTPAPGSGSYNYVIPFLANNANNFTTFLSIENIGTASASLTLQYYSSTGTALSTDGNGALAPNAIWNPTLKLTNGQSGAALVTSNQPLNIVVPEATKYGGSAYTVSGTPGNSLVAPLALNGAYGFVTQLNVFNGGVHSSNVTVSFYDSNGNLQSNATQTFSLAVDSLKTIDQTAIGLPANFSGWAQISGGNGDQLVAQVLEQNPATHFVAIANATTASTSLIAPAIFNAAFGSFVTGLNIVNPGSSAVTVTLTYHDASGNASAAPAFSIPSHGAQAIFDGATSGTGLPSGGLAANFAGSLTLSATSGVVMTVNEDGGTTSSGSRESGVYNAESAGKSNLSLPVMSNGAFGGYFTGSTLVNTSNQPVTVKLQYYDANGTAVNSALTFTIPAYGSHFNYQGGENPALPSGYFGDAVATITSGPANSLVSTANAISSQFFYSYVQP